MYRDCIRPESLYHFEYIRDGIGGHSRRRDVIVRACNERDIFNFDAQS